MNKETDNFDDFTKPTRQQQKGKKKKEYKDREEAAPKEVYKRQRINTRDVIDDEEGFLYPYEDDYL